MLFKIYKPHNEHLTCVITSISPALFPCYTMLANATFLLPWKYNGENHKRASHRRFLIGWKKIQYNKIYLTSLINVNVKKDNFQFKFK